MGAALRRATDATWANVLGRLVLPAATMGQAVRRQPRPKEETLQAVPAIPTPRRAAGRGPALAIPAGLAFEELRHPRYCAPQAHGHPPWPILVMFGWTISAALVYCGVI